MHTKSCASYFHNHPIQNLHSTTYIIQLKSMLLMGGMRALRGGDKTCTDKDINAAIEKAFVSEQIMQMPEDFMESLSTLARAKVQEDKGISGGDDDDNPKLLVHALTIALLGSAYYTGGSFIYVALREAGITATAADAFHALIRNAKGIKRIEQTLIEGCGKIDDTFWRQVGAEAGAFDCAEVHLALKRQNKLIIETAQKIFGWATAGAGMTIPTIQALTGKVTELSGYDKTFTIIDEAIKHLKTSCPSLLQSQ